MTHGFPVLVYVILNVRLIAVLGINVEIFCIVIFVVYLGLHSDRHTERDVPSVPGHGVSMAAV